MIRLFVFDLDGTLVDSRKDIAESANALLVACGARPIDEHAIGRMVGDGAATLVARAFVAAGVPEPPDALQRFLAIYDRRLLEHTRPYAGIPEVLDELSARTPMAVLTNKPLAATERILAGLDLARYFAPGRIVGGDGPFPRKPAPAGLRHLMTRSGATAARTILIGDSSIDWHTARNAGTEVCLARYGFGFEGFPVEHLRGDERFADSPAQFRQL